MVAPLVANAAFRKHCIGYSFRVDIPYSGMFIVTFGKVTPIRHPYIILLIFLLTFPNSSRTLLFDGSAVD